MVFHHLAYSVDFSAWSFRQCIKLSFVSSFFSSSVPRKTKCDVAMNNPMFSCFLALFPLPGKLHSHISTEKNSCILSGSVSTTSLLSPTPARRRCSCSCSIATRLQGCSYTAWHGFCPTQILSFLSLTFVYPLAQAKIPACLGC